jgi:hypothetical protein
MVNCDALESPTDLKHCAEHLPSTPTLSRYSQKQRNQRGTLLTSFLTPPAHLRAALRLVIAKRVPRSLP